MGSVSKILSDGCQYCGTLHGLGGLMKLDGYKMFVTFCLLGNGFSEN